MKVLIVDDSKVCRMLYRRELEKAGYETVEATDGVHALKLVQEHVVDLVLLDIEMPNMNGYEVCERLRSEEFTNRFLSRQDAVLPVVFVTSNNTMESRVKGFKKGATDFISKGFKPGTLASCVDGILKPVNPLNGLQVLVVDFSRFMRKMVKRFLEPQGMIVLEAATGKEAYDLLISRGREINLIISDFDLPDMPGDQLCKKARKELGLRGVPVIMLTSQDNRDLLLTLFTAGMTDYLVKPFEKEELVARIQAALGTIRALEQEIQERIGLDENDRGADMAAEALEKAHARVAGAAEMASSVIHNIGNVMNSVYVSCFQLSNQIKSSKLKQLLMAQQLLLDNQDDLTRFIKEDPRGKLAPEYLSKAGAIVEEEHHNLAREIEEITKKVDLMRDIIEVQQSHAKGSQRHEFVQLNDIFNDALNVQAGAIKKYDVQVLKDYLPMEPVYVERTTMTHIIINLIKNAIEAMREKDTRLLNVSIGQRSDRRGYLRVSDSGCGIGQEDLANVFNHGFTTKEDGHGFGLSYCSKMIKEMDGEIKVTSEGLGKGATFELLLQTRESISKRKEADLNSKTKPEDKGSQDIEVSRLHT